jgi:predicted lipid-binding transport protein (Tim44 family)
MRRKEMMAAGGVTLAGLGALVGLAIGSGDGGQKLLAQRIPPVEVRTEIVRRTVNVYRREHPHHASGNSPGLAGSASPAQRSTAPASATSRTRSSGARNIAPAAPEASGVTTLRTRSSGGSTLGGGSGSTRSVRTRTSGGRDGEGDGGGHGD